MPELGRAALVAALGLILYAAAVGAYAAWRGRRRLLDSATNALLAAFAATGVAALVLLAALAGRERRFSVRDIEGTASVPVVYTGSVPDLFKVGREVYVKGQLVDGVFVAKQDSLVTKCPSKYAPED